MAVHVVRIGEDAGRMALLVDGVVQSISPEDGLATGGYWAEMLPANRPPHALILGLGAGTLARPPPSTATAADPSGVRDRPRCRARRQPDRARPQPPRTAASIGGCSS